MNGSLSKKKKNILYGIPMVVRWSVEGKFEVLEKENWLYDVNVLHPYSTGIKNCTSAAVRFVFLYHCRVALPTIILCVREKKLRIWWIFILQSLKEHTMGRRLTYFVSVLFYSSLWCLFLTPYFKKMYILWIIVKVCFFFFLIFAGWVGEWLRKCSHFFVFIFLLFYSMDTWNVIGP